MKHENNQIILGVLFACASYFMYSLHYATMKWLGVIFPLWQLVFLRSVLMLSITLPARPSAVREIINTGSYTISTAIRSLFQLASVYCFYVAANEMPLAEVTTLYSAAPLIIVILSIFLLKETVKGFKWLAVIAGMVGTIIAAAPSGNISLKSTLLALGSGFFWALTVIFTRKSGSRQSTAAQLIIMSLIFCLISACLMDWKTPDTLFQIGLLIFLGLQIFFGQMFFFEACRYAPASLLGPLEYSSILWSCLLGFFIFGDLPTMNTIIGASLIVGGGILLAVGSRYKTRNLVLEKTGATLPNEK